MPTTTTRKTEQSKRLLERAESMIPGGVNSPVRAFGSVGGDPFFVASAEGARITDTNGKAYIDGPGFPELTWYLDYLWLGKAWTGPPPPEPGQKAVVATLRYWRPQAVVADAASRPALERYLTGIFGNPAIRYGSMIGWRT